jgi:hypothetical protein
MILSELNIKKTMLPRVNNYLEIAQKTHELYRPGMQVG